MKQIHSLLLALSLCILLHVASGCKGRKTDTHGRRVNVTVTIAPLEYFVKAIGGDSVSVTTLLPQGADSETFEPSVERMRAVGNADMLVSVGLLPFEQTLAERAVAGRNDIMAVRTADGLFVHRGADADHPGNADPHIWTSIKNASAIAQNVYDALIEIEPFNKEYYDANYAAFTHRLDSLRTAWLSQLKGAQGQTFAVWHPSLGYLAQETGLRQLPLGVEHKEASALGTAQAIDKARHSHPIALIVGPEADLDRVSTIAQPLGLQPVVVDVMSPDWERQMQTAVDALAAGIAAKQ